MDKTQKILGVLEMAALIGLVVAGLGLLVLLVSGPGHRFGMWDFRFGLTLVKIAAWIAIAGSLVSLIAFVGGVVKKHRRILMPSLIGLLIGGSVVGMLTSWKNKAQSLPRIHDITTDPEDAPEFIAIIPLRANAMNPSEYGGPEIAAQQREAYPHIAPHFMGMPPQPAFEKALAAAKRMGWEIVAAEPVTGRIEATDTTFWFGFKDDVVIRIRAIPEGSKLDVRSVSRVGLSDVGTNAKRIRAYLDALKHL